ncbi:Crp/Fnr family transcriptional regulator [Mucilaginibacter sp. CSA2-8R]|uniref:Crp/Fnr family transcriptional regulator n=1 Tax=Mucilaginibacter sp. CSA2-8R TaxID=3141542 RepID=UPI00315DA9EC
MHQLKSFISSQVVVNDDELQAIVSKFRSKTLYKGQLLLRRGQIANQYYFVNSGALRFFFEEEVSLTAWIVLPNEFFAEISSLSPQRPTRFNIEAVDLTELCYIDKTEMEILYKQIPAWQEFGRKLWEGMAIRMIDEIIRFQTLSAEERYLEFLKKPGVMQHVSIKQLASYLGITPNALSRIRKNLP